MSVETAAATAATMGLTAAQTAQTMACAGATAEQIANSLAASGFTAAQTEAALASAHFEKEQIKSAIATATFSAAEGTATTATVAFGTAIKNVAVGLWTFLTTNPVGWCVLAAGAIAGVTIAADALTESFDEAVDSANNARSEYESTTSELESLKSQLDETKSKITELKMQGSLSLTDQAELARLETQNDQLQLQYDIKKRLAEMQGKEAADAAANVLTKKEFKFQDVTYDGMGNLLGSVEGNNIIDYTRQQNDELQDLYSKREELQRRQDELLKEGGIEPGGLFGVGKGKNYDEYTSIEKQLTALEDKEKDLSSSIAENTEIINTNYNSLFDSSGKVIEGNEELAASCEELFKEMASGSEAAANTETAISTMLSKANLAGVKENLMDVAQSGSSALLSTVESSDELMAALDAAGVSAQDLTTYIMNLADPDSVKLENFTKTLRGVVAINNDAAEAFDEFFSEKAPKDILKFQDYINSNGIDISQWNLEDIKYNFDVAINGTEELKQASLILEDVKTTLTGVSAVRSAIASQGTGKSLSLDDFNSDGLKDYTSALEYVNGAYQLNVEKVNDLIEAKTKEQKAINDTSKAATQQAYLENAAQIEQLRQKIIDKNFAENESAESIQANIDALLSENNTLKSTIAQYDLMNASLDEATSAYQNWINAQSASQTGDMFDSALGAITKINDTLNKKDSDDYGRVGNSDYKAALEFILPDTVDSSDEDSVNKYLKSLSGILTLDKNKNFDGLNISEFCKKAVTEGLMVLEGDEYKVAGEKTMQDFADGMNMSLPLVQAVFGEMQEFGGEFDWADEGVKTLGDLGVAANEAAEHLRSLDENSDLRLVLNVSGFEDKETALSTLQSDIDQLTKYKATLSVDSTEYQEANQVIQYCIAQKQILTQPDVMTVNTSQVTGEIGNVLSLLQQS